MAQYGFGLGILTLSQADTATDRITPVVCGVLQDVSVEINMQMKELRGAFQFPLDVAKGPGTVQGKARFASLGVGTIATILNATPTNDTVVASVNKRLTPATNAVADTALEIPANCTFLEPLYVIDLDTGLVMKRMPDATTAATLVKNEYTCNPTTGALGFSSTAGACPSKIDFSFTYTAATAAAAGQTAALANQLMGAGQFFSLNLHNNYRSKHIGWKLPAVTLTKLGYGPKLDDYTTLDVDFGAFAHPDTGTVLEFFSAE